MAKECSIDLNDAINEKCLIVRMVKIAYVEFDRGGHGDLSNLPV